MQTLFYIFATVILVFSVVISLRIIYQHWHLSRASKKMREHASNFQGQWFVEKVQVCVEGTQPTIVVDLLRDNKRLKLNIFQEHPSFDYKLRSSEGITVWLNLMDPPLPLRLKFPTDVTPSHLSYHLCIARSGAVVRGG